MKKHFKIGDRVIHDFLGNATVMEIIKDGKYIAAYTIYTDESPDIRYNMGVRECLAWPEELKILQSKGEAMKRLRICLNDKTVEAIRNYKKVKTLSENKAINDLIMQGYHAACEEVKIRSLKRECKCKGGDAKDET